MLEFHQSVLLIDLGFHCWHVPKERNVHVNADSVMDYHSLPLYNMACFLLSLYIIQFYLSFFFSGMEIEEEITGNLPELDREKIPSIVEYL